MGIIIVSLCNALQLNLKLIFILSHFFYFFRFEGPSWLKHRQPQISMTVKVKTRNAKKEETEEGHHLCLMSITSGEKITNWQSATHSIFGLLVDGKLNVIHKSVCPCFVK